MECDMSNTAVVREVVLGHGENTVKPASKIAIVAGHANALAIRQQLDRMLQSGVFVQSARLSRFLQFIVEHSLAGNETYLKEYVIGSEVYERKPPYHPSQDSIVRTEARRLRSKIKDYYAAEGKDDLVYVYLRPGSYVPAFQYKEVLIGAERVRDVESHSLSAKSSATVVAILPFNDISGTALSSKYAQGIPEELAYILMRTEACRVISPSSTAHFCGQQSDPAVAMSKVGAQIAFEGSVREEGNRIRVTARIVDAAGFQLWTMRLDALADAQRSFAIEEKIASALSVGFDALLGNSRCQSVL
jgi:TolB-like protein